MLYIVLSISDSVWGGGGGALNQLFFGGILREDAETERVC